MRRERFPLTATRFNDDELREIALKGTTTVGIKFDGGVVIASDKRATSGTFVASRRVTKTIQITDYAVATISGLVADGQFLINNIKVISDLYSLDADRPLDVAGLAKLLAVLIRRYRPMFLLSHLIVGGVDRSGPHLFNVDFFGTITEEDYLATGSGSPVAISVIESGYRDGMSREEAIKLAISGMAAALSRDAATGDGMDVVIVDERGARFLAREEIERFLKETGL